MISFRLREMKCPSYMPHLIIIDLAVLRVDELIGSDVEHEVCIMNTAAFTFATTALHIDIYSMKLYAM
jgi:hypothetical protein